MSILALPCPPSPRIQGASVSSEVIALSYSDNTPDLIALLLEDKRSEDTKRAYQSDLNDFAQFSQKDTRAFLAQSTPQIALELAAYKSSLRTRALSEATINRRLAAIKSLLKFAHRLGFCQTDGRGLVDGEKVKHYRDTRGIDLKLMRKLIQAPGKKFGSALRGLRDLAILLLLCENALRRAEVCKLNESDFDFERGELSILGKGRGTQKEKVTVSENIVACLCTYISLKESNHTLLKESIHKSESNFETFAELACKDKPLFESLDRRPEYSGTRLTPDGLYQLTAFYGAQIGLKRLTPHQLRHSAITAALEMSKGDVRKVKKLSRHTKLETLIIYDDNRENFQGEMSNGLSKLLMK